MRILHVAESVKGGCGTYLNQLVRAQLADPDIEGVHVVLPDAHLVQVPDIPECNRVPFTSRGRSLRSLHALWRATERELATFQPDCVHLHSTFAGGVGRIGMALRRSRPPTVYCAHGWAFDIAGSSLKRRLMALAEWALAHSCDRIIAISEYERTRGISIGIAPKKVVTVLNGIIDHPSSPTLCTQDDQRPAGAPRRILFIGRLDRQKGVDVLLAALAGWEQQACVRIIGSSVVGDQAALRCDRPGVTMLGWCDDRQIREQLAWADCIAIPSRWEGFGLVALEAMRAGRAVVASNVGGLPEVIEHGVTGWLVPPDDPAALRAALLAPSDAQLTMAGAAGRQRFVQRFTIERTAAALSAVYGQAVAIRNSISHAFA